MSAWFGGGDCGPSDPMTFPGAIDLPDDGIDQDCHWRISSAVRALI